MDVIYYLVSSLEGYNDAYGFHSLYFVEEGGFLNAFIIALLSAAAFIFIFYVCICNFFHSLSKFYVWVIALLLTGFVTTFVTSHLIVGGENEQSGEYTGFYASIDAFAAYKLEEYSNNPEERRKIIDEKDQLMEQDLSGENGDYKVVENLYIMNCIYSLLIFFILSIFVKGITKYGIAIPFTWPRKFHNSIK